MFSVYVHQNGGTRRVDRIEAAWLEPAARATVWVDVTQPSEEEARLLRDTFQFHPLAIEDALSAIQFPKIEPYEGYLYLVLHSINVKAQRIATHDIDFFLGPNYLVTVHDGTSRSIARMREICDRNERVLAEGPVGLLHRIVDAMVDHYQPVVDDLEKRIAELEDQALSPRQNIMRRVMRLKHDLAGLRRVLVPQRDAVARLARREFAAISDEMAYRFRDVYDHLFRTVEETAIFNERMTALLEVNLATISNRLNQVMKVLTVIATIFLPLTVLTGMWGMNVPLPRFPGGDQAQFWWVSGLMAAIAVVMLAIFRRNDWI